MKRSRIFLPLLLLTLVALAASAQERIMRMGGPDGKVRVIKGEIFDIPELGALIIKGDDGLKVEHVMPAEARPKAYADVDIKSGDLVLLVNGKRVKTIKDVEKQYGAVAVGEEIKLGLQRGEETLISRFAKADPKDLPQRKIIMRKSDGGKGDADSLGKLEPGEKVIIKRERK